MTADQVTGAVLLAVSSLWYAARWFARKADEVIRRHVSAALDNYDARFDIDPDPDADRAAVAEAYARWSREGTR